MQCRKLTCTFNLGKSDDGRSHGHHLWRRSTGLLASLGESTGKAALVAATAVTGESPVVGAFGVGGASDWGQKRTGSIQKPLLKACCSPLGRRYSSPGVSVLRACCMELLVATLAMVGLATLHPEPTVRFPTTRPLDEPCHRLPLASPLVA
jgi:hypothetical protein